MRPKCLAGSGLGLILDLNLDLAPGQRWLLCHHRREKVMNNIKSIPMT
jgi:hypothetical protein